jgi:hypothetical protein
VNCELGTGNWELGTVTYSARIGETMTEDSELVERAQAGEVAANKGNKWYLEHYSYVYKEPDKT